MPPYIQTDRFSAALRSRGIDLANRRILITKYRDSLQTQDLTLPANCQGWGRIHHFYRGQSDAWLPNPLPIDPASRWLGLNFPDLIQAQVFQNAICSWRCWYCFVDFRLLSADSRYSSFLTAEEMLDLYLAEDGRPSIIDLSGGQPDLVPEWVLWFADAVAERGLQREIYLWSDDNLSNDYLWRFLGPEEVRRLSSYRNYGRVGCFKGFDSDSFAFNTHAEPTLFRQQFTRMKKTVDLGFDVYGYATFTALSDESLARRMSDFLDQLQELVHPIFPLRLVPLEIKAFTPTRRRMNADHERAIAVQKQVLLAWNQELQRRFSAPILEKRIFEHELR